MTRIAPMLLLAALAACRPDADADAPSRGFRTGVTPISGLSPEELNGLDRSKRPDVPDAFDLVEDDGAVLPPAWDWRWFGAVTEIRDQAKPRYCGSCWAFGTVAAFESAIMIKTGRRGLHVSEQELVSCSDYGSCGGGYFAFGHYESKGAVYDADFPYQASDVRCKQGTPGHERVASWGYLGRDREATTDELKRALYRYGPVAVTISASGAYNDYTGGVYDDCNRSQTNHIVALVGWDDRDEAWILKNSHGTAWGEEGFMRIKWTDGSGRKCNRVGEDAAFAVFEPSEGEAP